jgi:hypothetical protein
MSSAVSQRVFRASSALLALPAIPPEEEEETRSASRCFLVFCQFFEEPEEDLYLPKELRRTSARPFFLFHTLGVFQSQRVFRASSALLV